MALTRRKKYQDWRWAMLGLWLWTGAAAATEGKPVHHDTAEACKTCHTEIYQQWKSSLHAQSSALSDPIHAALYKSTVGDPTVEELKTEAGQYPGCLFCHAPNAARDGKTKLDAKEAYAEGVNCMVCHTLARYKGTTGADGKPQLGLNAYALAAQLQGPQGFASEIVPLSGVEAASKHKREEMDNPHLGADAEVPLAGNPPLYRTTAACMGCHDKRNNPQGVPLCTTGEEAHESRNYTPCQSCHMPNRDGVADHSMSGGHDLATLRRAGVFTLVAEPAGDSLRISATLYNHLPHNLPTGAPFRNIYLKLSAYDAQGALLWQNYREDPAKEDPQAYLTYSLSDDAGHPAAPHAATRAGQDSRLKPNETRVLSYQIPAQKVALVRGEVYYSLLWPELAAKFPQLPLDARTPKRVWFAEAKL